VTEPSSVFLFAALILDVFNQLKDINGINEYIPVNKENMLAVLSSVSTPYAMNFMDIINYVSEED